MVEFSSFASVSGTLCLQAPPRWNEQVPLSVARWHPDFFLVHRAESDKTSVGAYFLQCDFDMILL